MVGGPPLFKLPLYSAHAWLFRVHSEPFHPRRVHRTLLLCSGWLSLETFLTGCYLSTTGWVPGCLGAEGFSSCCPSPLGFSGGVPFLIPSGSACLPAALRPLAFWLALPSPVSFSLGPSLTCVPLLVCSSACVATLEWSCGADSGLPLD